MDDSKAPWPESVLKSAGGAEVRAFFGYLVDVSDAQTRQYRLYLTLDLDDYIEISGSQIIHIKHVDQPEQPLGGSYVWVRRTARLRRVGGRSTEAQADFLRGEIEMELRGGVSVPNPGGPPPGTGYHCTTGTYCPPCAKPVRSEADY